MKDSIVLEEPSSSTAYGDVSSSGGRAIDRHNPIIRDEKRLAQGRTIFLSNSTITINSATIPDHNHNQVLNLMPAAEEGHQKKKSIAFTDNDGGFISPASSSRCLLGEKATFNFSSESDDHVMPPPPSPPLEPLIFKNGRAFVNKKDDNLSSLPPPPPSPPPRDHRLWFLTDDDEDDYDDSPSSSPPKPPPLPPPEPMDYNSSKASKKKNHDPVPAPPASATLKPPSPPTTSDKVVVLEVSLHCRGCERKVKKHISKIEGVKSFKIEFEARKVTVVGDVTPLAVLTSVMKVKNAKVLTPTSVSSSQVGSIPNS